ncbi:MAG: hypothetical protein GWO16_08985, partial [Gammaproteobacteria bacterium]|nr:hypothetical protein [Gammaproteobacteria bacterium]
TAVLGRFIEQGWVNLIGGCCGTTAAHTRAFAELAAGKAPRTPAAQQRSLLSGIEFL